ncbi:MAG: argininosuccinate lyase [Flavobacteriaceae bacterium]
MKLWQKKTSIDQKIDAFTVGNDRQMDLILAAYDCQASIAHAEMLAQVGLLTAAEAQLLVIELQHIQKEAETGKFTIEAEFEDMHSKIEYLLVEKLGDLGKKIHTARSRNDQVLVALQLYFKDALEGIEKQSLGVFDLLLDLAATHEKKLMPGYTHMQVAMPSSFGLWFSAYAESLIDDHLLLHAAYKIVDQNPLGSAAGFGSSFAIDREKTTEALGFSTLKYNVVAAQMGRGKVERSVATALAALAATLGKMAIDICLYMGQDYGFIRFPDALTTGSSIMPHKKNPDVFELIRGKCNLLQTLPQTMSQLTTNLPSGYHRDLQLSKEPILNAVEDLKSCLDLFQYALAQIEVSSDLLAPEKYDTLFTVETLNEWVKEGMPFRTAYQKMGAQVAEGTYQPKRDLAHVHLGSIGNLALEDIRKKMATLGKC